MFLLEETLVRPSNQPTKVVRVCILYSGDDGGVVLSGEWQGYVDIYGAWR